MDYKSILKCRLIGLKVGVDNNNKAHFLEIFGREVEDGGSPTPTEESNLVNGEGTYSLKQRSLLSNGVTGSNSAALGGGNSVSGDVSFAIGGVNSVTHNHCVALGVELSSGASNQVLLGQYNYVNSSSAIALGIGESQQSRVNAIDITKEGLVYVKGIGDYDGTSIEDAKDLATVISEGGGGSGDITSLYIGFANVSWSSVFAKENHTGQSSIIITVELATWIKNAALGSENNYILSFKNYTSSTTYKPTSTRFSFTHVNNAYTMTFAYFGSSNSGLDVCTITGTLTNSYSSIASVDSVSVTLAS